MSDINNALDKMDNSLEKTLLSGNTDGLYDFNFYSDSLFWLFRRNPEKIKLLNEDMVEPKHFYLLKYIR